MWNQLKRPQHACAGTPDQVTAAAISLRSVRHFPPIQCFSYLFPQLSSSVKTRNIIKSKKAKTKACDSPCLCCHLTGHSYAPASLQRCLDPMKSLRGEKINTFLPHDKTSWAQAQYEEAAPLPNGLTHYSSYAGHSVHENNFMQKQNGQQ